MLTRKSIAVCAVALIIPMMLSHDDIRTNREALNIIGNAEGCFLQPYYCPTGMLTDGIGNIKGVESGNTLTIEEVARDWLLNVREAELCVNRRFRGKDMPEDTFGAMVSVAFNLGCYRLLTYYDVKSGKRVETTIHKRAQLMQWKEMCEEIPSFNNRGKYPGLVIRREKEKNLCLKSIYE